MNCISVKKNYTKRKNGYSLTQYAFQSYLSPLLQEQIQFAVSPKTYLSEGVLTTPIEAEPFIIKSGVVAISIDGTAGMALVIRTLPLCVFAGAETNSTN